MNISLTMQFDTVLELETFLSNRVSTTGATPNHDVAAPPTVLEVVPPLVAAPAPVVDPVSDPLDPVIATEDSADLRASLMVRLRDMAGSMDDPAVLGKFINGFGVARFSEIADEDLPAFKGALENEFGIA